MNTNLTDQAADTADIPHFTYNDFRTAASVILRRVAERENNGQITEDDANERVAGLLAYRRGDLTQEDRAAAYEQLREAVRRLDEVTSDMFDPSQYEEDQVTLEGLAEDDIESAIRKLVGPRR